MDQFAADEAVRLREEAQHCRLLARLISLKHEARRLLEMGQACEARATAIEQALAGRELRAA